MLEDDIPLSRKLPLKVKKLGDFGDGYGTLQSEQKSPIFSNFTGNFLENGYKYRRPTVVPFLFKIP